MAESVPVEDHLARVLALVTPLAPVTVPTADAMGLVSAADVTAPTALPRFDHAAMDGYAVRAADVSAPVSLPVAGVVAAGDASLPSLTPGTAWRIMTGAPVPSGADAVVPFEWTDRGVDVVAIGQTVATGRHIRRAGEDVVAGSVVVATGALLAPAHLALIAGVGVGSVSVHPAPRVAVIATGAELVVGGASGAGEVSDSNTVAISAAAAAAGATVQAFGPVPDAPAALLEQVLAAAELADLVVTTGGISAGDHDVVKAALRGRDGFWFGGVAVKPGRPQGCGLILASDGRRVPVLCLPGTPVAAYSSFRLFAEPALRALAGRVPRSSARAVLDAPVDVASDRTLVLPAVQVGPGRVAQLPGHVGHSQRLLAAADVLLVMPPGDAPVPAGAEVEILPLG
ncbi:molybdopterin molybdotransferase MoeA [Nocardioides humilatus]|uniref:Molybdopterin molybdenumtransferase n=1 Tax=Nocardioides humilatus TaxID=2607660 RepID=A0A5B1LG93_9ACTN|nr:gephyrin-like molybdotransferase Glp [Nocardioides humilatus]KAA1419364.1 molybdopterin molybdotransferase MoeA [Nocardioides humilatus]